MEERYEIQGFIGSGGFSHIYRATLLGASQQRTLAIKVLHQLIGNEDERLSMLKMFAAEADLVARISHPNVVQFEDFGFLPSGRPFIVMNYLEGRDLKEVLVEDGAIAPARALTLFGPLLEAMEEGHSKGVVHRDIKPANLFLTGEGSQESLVILDFGIAQQLDSSRGEKRAEGVIVATPAYASPEWVKKKEISPRIDVYQLALLLVEMLTGVPVVNVDDAYACFAIHCNGELELPQKLMDSPLGPVLRKALETDPGERFADAGMLKVALGSIDPARIPEVSDDGPKVALFERRGRHRREDFAPKGVAQGLSYHAEHHTEKHLLRVKTSSIFILLAALFVLAAGVGGVFLLIELKPHHYEATDSLAPKEEENKRVDAVEEPAEVVEEAEIEVSISVQSEPTGAKIWVDGVERGTTPISLRYDSIEAPKKKVLLRKRGYRRLKATIAPDEGPKVLFKLKKRTRKQKREPEKKDAPKERVPDEKKDELKERVPDEKKDELKELVPE